MRHRIQAAAFCLVLVGMTGCSSTGNGWSWKPSFLNWGAKPGEAGAGGEITEFKVENAPPKSPGWMNPPFSS